MNSRIRSRRRLAKTYVLYKTKNFFFENQRLMFLISQYKKIFTTMKNYAALQQCGISY